MYDFRNCALSWHHDAEQKTAVSKIDAHRRLDFVGEGKGTSPSWLRRPSQREGDENSLSQEESDEELLVLLFFFLATLLDDFFLNVSRYLTVALNFH